MSNENYPANYRAYLNRLPIGGTLPPNPYRCANCKQSFATGKARNEHVRGGCR